MDIYVVVQEQERLLREGLTRLLDEERSLTMLGSVATDRQLIRLCAEKRPDVAVIQADAPEWDVARLAIRLQARLPGLRFVGTHSDACDEARLEGARRAGLAVLVPHSAGSAGVHAAIREVLSRPVPRLAQAAAVIEIPPQLTEREDAILRLIGAGNTCRDISEQLGISSKTVENHKQRIFRKLGVQNQSHALAEALRSGLVDPAVTVDTSFRAAVGHRASVEKAPVEVVIGQDDVLQAEILASACAARGIRVMAVCRTADELLEACDRFRPGVAVAADRFDFQPLEQVLTKILSLDVRMIVISHDRSAERVSALLLDEGVHGYLSRNATPDEVVTGILAVARGAAAIDHSTASVVLGQLRGFRSRLVSRMDLGLGMLTQREQDVLHAMARGLATKSIARELGVAVKTVENHKIRVFEKLGVRTQAEAVTVALTYGLVADTTTASA